MLEKSKCIGCTVCKLQCPKQCIQMVIDEEGFKYPEIDERNCIHCNKCEMVCPVLQQKNGSTKEKTRLYAIKNMNQRVREHSSSGGVFSLISENVLNEKGIVIGAAFAEDFSVQHIVVKDKKNLEKLQGSKYVQSDLGEIFFHCKQELEKGVLVLFSGTPCQNEALKKYLGREYENLICIDIVCHGVPSPKLWKMYINYRRKKDVNDSEKIQEINFRSKLSGWKRYSILFQYEKTKYLKHHYDDSFLQAYSYELISRPACYSCKFRGIKRNVDITLADFWGIENVLPDFCDDIGVSLLMVHTRKGMKLIDEVRDNIKCIEVDAEDVIKYNKSIIQSPVMNKKRKRFMKKVTEENFEECVQKILTVPLLEKILNRVKRVGK